MGGCLGIYMAEWIFFRLDPHTFLHFFLGEVNTQFEEELLDSIKCTVLCPLYEFRTHGPTINENKQRRKVLATKHSITMI